MQADAHEYENEKNNVKNNLTNSKHNNNNNNNNSNHHNNNKNSSNDDSSYSSNSINTHKKNHDIAKITTDSVSNNIMPILDEGIEKIGREVRFYFVLFHPFYRNFSFSFLFFRFFAVFFLFFFFLT